MRYVLAGASGFLGRALQSQLERDGHEVRRLVRREPRSPEEFRWDPARDELDAGVLTGAGAVVNLAVASQAEPPVFVVQVGSSYYGDDRGTEDLDEDSTPTAGFLAGVVRRWEQAAMPAEEAGARVIYLRSGAVLDGSGGALPLLSVPFRLGLGGRLGSGRQYMPMVSLPDWLAAVRFVVDDDGCSGAYNLTLPEPATNAELTRALGQAMGRPTVVAVPRFAMRAILGGFATELLGSRRLHPRRLLAAGFTFTAPDVNSLVAVALHGG
jgi:uncharacterized protein (TIGR01777 family)